MTFYSELKSENQIKTAKNKKEKSSAKHMIPSVSLIFFCNINGKIVKRLVCVPKGDYCLVLSKVKENCVKFINNQN